MSPGTVQASHFRSGHYTWKQAGGNTIEVTLQNAWRRDGYGCVDPASLSFIPCSPGDGFPQVGDVILEAIGGTQFNWGDGTSPVGSPLGPLFYLVTSIDPVSNWWFGLALDPASLPAIDTTLSHTYAALGNYTAFTDSCCRIAGVDGVNEHINNPSGNYRIETIINVGATNNSPVSTLPPIVLCPIDALCTFIVPGADPDGDALSFRLSTSDEAGLGFTQPGLPVAPNSASINPVTGIYMWNTTEAALAGNPANNTLYSTQVTIEDSTSKVAVDFLIQLVDEDVNPPVIQPPAGSPPICGTTQVATVGNTKNFDVIASDPDVGDIVTLNVVGLPVGAAMTPSLPVADNPVSSTFSWTPNSGQVGVHVATFSAASTGGGFVLCSVTIEVTEEIFGTITGTVFVSSGLTILGASVLAEPGGFSAQTGPDGAYSISVPLGIYTVTASTDGYSPDSQSNVEVTGAATTIDLVLGSPLIASVGIGGKGLLKFIAEILKVTIGAVLEVLKKGAGTLWNGILASLDIFKAGKIGDQFRSPAYWADFFNDAYKVGKPQTISIIDGCASGIFSKTWLNLSEEERLDKELQTCILATAGGGYTSGIIAPKFMKEWLE